MELSRVGLNTVTVEFGGERLTVKYRRQSLKAVLELADRAEQGERAALEESLDWLAGSLVEWDLTDGGTPVDISREVLETLPIGLVVEIMRAVQREYEEAAQRPLGT